MWDVDGLHGMTWMRDDADVVDDDDEWYWLTSTMKR